MNFENISLTNMKQESIWESSNIVESQQKSKNQSNAFGHQLIKNDRKKSSLFLRLKLNGYFQGFIVGILVGGLILSIILTLWLTSKKTSTSTQSLALLSLISIQNSSNTTLNTTQTTTTSTISTSSTSQTTTQMKTCADWLWNSTGETIFGTTSLSGNTLNLLNEPWNLFLDRTETNLYIADSNNHRILKLNLIHRNITIVAGISGSIGSTSMLLHNPKDIFIDENDHIYVADSKNNRIQYFPHGSSIGQTLSINWNSTGELWAVQVVNQSIYALDYSKSAVWNNGTAIAGNQGSGSLSNQLNKPQGFSIDTSISFGTMYLVNSQQHTIVQWMPGASSGNIVAGINGVQGNSAIHLNYPVSIKLDSYSNMFVVDNNNHRIQLFCRNPIVNSTGRTIIGTGNLGQTSTTLNYPTGLTLDSSLNIYVADTSNHRIQKFQRIH